MGARMQGSTAGHRGDSPREVPEWFACEIGCPECGGFGWHVADDCEFQRDDTCRALESDAEATEHGALFAQAARDFLLKMATAQFNPTEARREACRMMGLPAGSDL